MDWNQGPVSRCPASLGLVHKYITQGFSCKSKAFLGMLALVVATSGASTSVYLWESEITSSFCTVLQKYMGIVEEGACCAGSDRALNKARHMTLPVRMRRVDL